MTREVVLLIIMVAWLSSDEARAKGRSTMGGVP
jgi:hypothetical protein